MAWKRHGSVARLGLLLGTALVLAAVAAPSQAAWRHYGLSRGFIAQAPWTDVPYYGDVGVGSTYFADVTGDGRADAIAVNSQYGVNVRPATSSGDLGTVGSGSFAANQQWTDIPFYGDKGTFFADVNGDGKADAIAVTTSLVATTTVRLSSGSSFLPNQQWTDVPFYGDKGTFFADVTGDGKADAIVVNTNTPVTVRPSTGVGFSGNQSWTAAAWYGSVTTAFADVTGDGKADLIAVDNGSIQVRPSTGGSFGTAQIWSSIGFYGDRGTFFADVTGDGRADAIAVNGTLPLVVRRSLYAPDLPIVGFGANEQWTDVPYSGVPGRTAFADVTADGRADAIVVDNTAVTVRQSDNYGKQDPAKQPGPGILLANRPGFYYMGRLLPGDTFDRNPYSGNSTGEYVSAPSPDGGYQYTYRWGHAQGVSNACLWAGPRANSGLGLEFLTTSLGSPANDCPSAAVTALQDRNYFGTGFNCPDGTAQGPTSTTMNALATFYYNVNWKSDFSGVNYPGNGWHLLHAGDVVKYRYKTRDGNWAVVYAPGLGWGFVAAGTVNPITSKPNGKMPWDYEDHTGADTRQC